MFSRKVRKGFRKEKEKGKRKKEKGKRKKEKGNKTVDNVDYWDEMIKKHFK